MAIWNSIGGAIGRAYDYLTPGLGSSRLTDWGGWGDAGQKASGGGGGGGGWGSSTSKTISSNNKANKDAWDEIARLRSQLQNMSYSPPQPRLAQFDIMANWRNARAQAERAQNPKYQKQLNDFLARNAQKKATKKKEFGLTKEGINLEKAQTMEDNQISRERTTEDVANAIDKINQGESYYQQDEGRDFDTNYRQVAEDIAAAGASQTGIGRQQTSDMIRLRNVQNQRQLDEFQGQREAKNLFKTRTFEDLLRGDERAATLAENKTKAAQLDFDSYLEDLAYDEKTFRFQNEADRLEAILRDTGNYEKAGVEAFLGSLAGQGYSASDIAYNRSIYA